MPNWVTNNVTITADKKLLAKIRKELKGDKNAEGEQRLFDFNKIAPIPKELEGTRSPMVAITQKEYDEQERKIAENDFTEQEKMWGISRCLTQKMINEYNKKFGACDWYTWQNANWGTKWNACDVSWVADDLVCFNTAWSTPFAIMVKLSEKYPEATFTIEFADEDFGHNVGEYTLKGGIEIEENVPDGGSREALEMAMRIQYGGAGEYDFDDVFVDLWDDEITDYVENMIDIAYDHNVLPFEDCGWHKLVLEIFKAKALADEKYELVMLIDNEMSKVTEDEE